MDLPDFLLTGTATVEPYAGSGAYGKKYGPGASVRCYTEDKRRVVRDRTGAEVISETTMWCRLAENVPAESRVTVNGRATTVITVSRFEFDGTTPNHLEVALE